MLKSAFLINLFLLVSVAHARAEGFPCKAQESPESSVNLPYEALREFLEFSGSNSNSSTSKLNIIVANRGGEGSGGGGDFEKEEFNNVGFEALDLLRRSGVRRVGDFEIDPMKLRQIFSRADVRKSVKPFSVNGRDTDAWTFPDNTILFHGAAFAGKHLSGKGGKRRMVVHEILRVARIPDDNDQVSAALELMCGIQESTEQLIRERVSERKCVFGSEVLCFPERRLMDLDRGITACEKNVTILCGGDTAHYGAAEGQSLISLRSGQFYAGPCFGSVVVCR
ncbi:MAG: hypothetical protein NDJ89_03635 [Oligoflexia bacterium]|nr:hypothetical protein [Oligoflexia bacterium]